MAKKETVKEIKEVKEMKETVETPKINYIDDSVSLLNITHLGKHVELCARNAYKSEDKTTETSWEGMVKGLKKQGHNSCFEHAPIYLEVNPRYLDKLDELAIKLIKSSKYARVTVEGFKTKIYTNARVILETVPSWLDELLKGTFNRPGITTFNPSNTDPNRRVSLRIISSRVIIDSILRHRVFSPTCESTRYVDYLGKFSVSSWTAHETTKEQDEELKAAFEDCKKHYDRLKELGAHKDVCRLVLALGIKADLIFTGYADDFLGNFYELRIASNADKTVQQIASKVEKLIN